MLKHIVMYKLKDSNNDNKTALVDKFMSMKGEIPELVDVNAGANFLESERSYDVVLEAVFRNKADLAKYLEHPFHVGVRDYVRSVVEKSHSVDYLVKETYATINLADGRSMTAKLFKDSAPLSVDNFVSLATSGYYDGLIFHRVIEDFMIQGGGMYENLDAKTGAKRIKGEFISNGVSNDVRHTIGTLSMARTNDPNSATSQFFICVNDTPHLDGQYAAFGRLIDEDSIAVAVDISKVKTRSVGYYDDVPVDPIIIKGIDIFEE